METKKDKDAEKKLEMLLSIVDKVYPPLHVLMWRSFVQGIFVALGTTIGLSIVLAVVTFMIHQLQLIPIIRDIINSSQVEQIIPSKR